MLFALALLGSCGGGFEDDPPEEPSPWTTGALSCLSGDGCPLVRCFCADGPDLPDLRGCVQGTCIDDPERFCSDFCESRGGRTNQTIIHLYACLNAPDRDACLSCRDAAARECNAGVCAADLDTMLTCIEPYTPSDLPDGVEYHDWSEPEDGGDCYPERIGHRNCILDDCPAFDSCIEERDYHPPIARD